MILQYYESLSDQKKDDEINEEGLRREEQMRWMPTKFIVKDLREAESINHKCLQKAISNHV